MSFLRTQEQSDQLAALAAAWADAKTKLSDRDVIRIALQNLVLKIASYTGANILNDASITGVPYPDVEAYQLLGFDDAGKATAAFILSQSNNYPDIFGEAYSVHINNKTLAENKALGKKLLSSSGTIDQKYIDLEKQAGKNYNDYLATVQLQEADLINANTQAAQTQNSIQIKNSLLDWFLNYWYAIPLVGLAFYGVYKYFKFKSKK